MDHVLDYMKKHNLPLTREKYLEMAYLGSPPEGLDPEEEAALPKEFQKNPTEYTDPDNED
jgi:hypothetical protein